MHNSSGKDVTLWLTVISGLYVRESLESIVQFGIRGWSQISITLWRSLKPKAKSGQIQIQILLLKKICKRLLPSLFGSAFILR